MEDFGTVVLAIGLIIIFVYVYEKASHGLDSVFEFIGEKIIFPVLQPIFKMIGNFFNNNLDKYIQEKQKKELDKDK